MSQKTKARASKKRTVRKRKERRFATHGNYMAPWVAAIGLLGALLLGGGVFGLWIKDPPIEYASYLVALGGLGLGIALWFAQSSLAAIYVGDGGVALEIGTEIERLPWCDIESIRVVSGRLIIRAIPGLGGPPTLSFPLKAHPAAAAWVLKEAAERMPDALDVQKEVLGGLPAPDSSPSTAREIEDAQVAGRRCASSRKVIAFESDARLCPRCGQVYHKDHVPSACVTCEDPLSGRTLQP